MGMTSSPPHQRLIDVFLHYLRRENVHVAFGVPGGLLHPFFDAMENEAAFQLVVTKHEQGAAFMADGFARASGKMAICAGTSGPGSTNMMTGVAVAYSDGIPMLVITGQAPSHTLGRGAAQETGAEDMDIVAMFRPITKYSAMIPSPEKFPHHLRRALRLATTGRPGPVHLNVPVDFWLKPLVEDWFDPQSYRPTPSLFDRDAVRLATKSLVAAQYPVILAGSGLAIANGQEHLRQLAEMLQIRVATTPRAKGVFPEDHPLSLGVLGFAGHATARETILGPHVDVLFTVGASLNETTTFNWHPEFRPSQALLQLDVDVDRVGRNYPVDVALVGDARAVLTELYFHVKRTLDGGQVPQSKWPEAPALDYLQRYLDPHLRQSREYPLTPQRWRVELQEVLPTDAIIFSDIGGHMLFNIHHLCIGQDQRFILNLGFGSMGHGTNAPIGAKIAYPDRPVLSIVGDACFMMNGMEVHTASEYDIPVIWIVENNQMHGITWHGSKTVSGGKPMDSVRNRKPLYVAPIAKAMGLETWSVSRPGELRPALNQALRTREPCLIEILVDGDISPPLGDRAKTIAGFRNE